ncbi:MAG: endopeptidase La, partial [Leptospiraceae bacterium]|nr:endopeptidase La [Leptospiraceae bacterium]
SGQLGDVMKESITAATVLLKSQASEFGVDLDKDVEKFNFHVHVPAGATPKDGPSAGAAMLTAIFSAATGRAVRKDVAMTGEITTIGDVTAIGGLREKLAAASRAGCTTVIIPQENEKDLDEVPQSIKDALDIHPVSHVSEVLKIALVGGYEPTTSPANDDKDVPSLLKAPVRAPHN